MAGQPRGNALVDVLVGAGVGTAGLPRPGDFAREQLNTIELWKNYRVKQDLGFSMDFCYTTLLKLSYLKKRNFKACNAYFSVIFYIIFCYNLYNTRSQKTHKL